VVPITVNQILLRAPFSFKERIIRCHYHLLSDRFNDVEDPRFWVIVIFWPRRKKWCCGRIRISPFAENVQRTNSHSI